jgi:hypothetical protein
MYRRGLGDIIDGWWFITKILSVLSVLGLWKLVDIIIWLFKYVNISIG